MKVDDKQFCKTFYDYEPGECFVDEYGNYYMKYRDSILQSDGTRKIVFKAVCFENGLTNEFSDSLQLRPVNAKVVIE